MILSIHPKNPQMRLVQQAVLLLADGGVLAYPTDTLFGIGCDVRRSRSIDAISRITGRDKRMMFSFLCCSFSQADQYAKISDAAYRLMKRVLPGPYTFILPATSLVPKKISERRKTVGIRIPCHTICQALITELGFPLANASIEFEEGAWSGDAYSVHKHMGHQVDAVIDDGSVCAPEPSTVVDVTGEVPVLVRQGKGDTSFLGW